MQLLDETVWMLSISGRLWTDDRLRTAAAILAAISSEAIHIGKVERRLANAIGVESVQLRSPSVDRIEAAEWGLEAVAAAVNEPKRILAAELEDARREFAGGLDSVARDLSTTDGHADIAMYNYLAHKTHKHYRQQFAEVFPGVLQTTVAATPGGMGPALRLIVDEGAPVIKGLAAEWGVRPGVVRHLIGLPREHIGVRWSKNMKGLAMLLDVLRPEDMPSDDAESWRRLNRASSVGQSILGKVIHEDSAAKTWLRECVFRTNRGTDRTKMVWLPDDEELGNIAQFKYSLTAALNREIPASDVTVDAAKQKALRREVHRFLLRNANKGLVTFALRFEEHLDALRREPVEIARVLNADALWPLIPRDFVSADGTRVVTPLTSRAQLTAHGESIVNCLAGGTRERYLRKGKNGRLFILGILDAKTRRPCSTAEISASFGSERLCYKLEVKQHTA